MLFRWAGATAVRLAVATFCIVVSVCPGATVTLIPSADATLIEIVPDNSMGAAAYFTAGTTQNGPRNRAVLKFDIASAIAAGSKITAVSLTVDAIKQSREAPAGASYGLHRLLRSWGEGNNLAESQPGLGSPAGPNDATWNARFFPTNRWAQPGGAEGTDYLAQVTSTVIVDLLDVYQFDNTFELIAEIQFWLDHPDQNFGWLLKGESEEIRFTARQFASREYADPALAPQLAVEFIPPPHVDIARTNDGGIGLTVTPAEAGSYVLEFQGTLGGTNGWSTLTNFGFVAAQTVLAARDTSSAAQRFYRARPQ